MNGLPGCRVAGKRWAVQIDIHVVQKACKLVTRQPGHHTQMSVGIQAFGTEGSRQAIAQCNGGPTLSDWRRDPEFAATHSLCDPGQQNIIRRIKFNRLLAQGEADNVSLSSWTFPVLRLDGGHFRADTRSG